MKEQWRKLAQAAARALPTLLLAGGGAGLAWGVGMVFPPAGVMAAGLLMMAAGVLLIGGERSGHG